MSPVKVLQDFSNVLSVIFKTSCIKMCAVLSKMVKGWWTNINRIYIMENLSKFVYAAVDLVNCGHCSRGTLSWGNFAENDFGQRASSPYISYKAIIACGNPLCRMLCGIIPRHLQDDMSGICTRRQNVRDSAAYGGNIAPSIHIWGSRDALAVEHWCQATNQRGANDHCLASFSGFMSHLLCMCGLHTGGTLGSVSSSGPNLDHGDGARWRWGRARLWMMG